MFEKEKDFHDRLDNVMDSGTITFSCEDADVLKDIVCTYLNHAYEFGEVIDE
jgi:hypothetical protein